MEVQLPAGRNTVTVDNSTQKNRFRNVSDTKLTGMQGKMSLKNSFIIFRRTNKQIDATTYSLPGHPG